MSHKHALYLGCALLTALILGLDLSLPLGVAMGVPYVAVVLLSLWFPRKNQILWVALLCSILIVGAFFCKPEIPDMWKAVSNRILALLAIWGIALLGVQRRVSEETRERALRALAESEATLARIFRTSPIGLALVATDGRLLKVNPAISAILGWTEAELLGATVKELTCPEDLARYQQLAGEVIEGQRQTFQIESRYLHQQGHQVVCQVTVHLVRDAQQAPLHFACHIRDISARKRAEEEREQLEAQLQQAQKMESVGRLAGGVAHDFNTMLGIILGYAELALEQLDPTQPLHEELTEIHKAARRSADLTGQLLAFARKQNIAPKVLDLNQSVAEMLKLLERLLGEGIHVHWQPDENLWPVKIDPSQLDHVLTNLCINARDAMAGQGRLAIETTNCAIDTSFCARRANALPGEYVRLSVKDDGHGMDRHVLSKIFEPFFTTKGVGQGTGLGLASVYGAVTQNQGFIDVSSEPGQGATFDIYLPRFRAA